MQKRPNLVSVDLGPLAARLRAACETGDHSAAQVIRAGLVLVLDQLDAGVGLDEIVAPPATTSELARLARAVERMAAPVPVEEVRAHAEAAFVALQKLLSLLA